METKTTTEHYYIIIKTLENGNVIIKDTTIKTTKCVCCGSILGETVTTRYIERPKRILKIGDLEFTL